MIWSYRVERCNYDGHFGIVSTARHLAADGWEMVQAIHHYDGLEPIREWHVIFKKWTDVGG
jgi:hypothetical protein